MANYSTLKSTINSNIRQNGSNAITGSILQSVLNAMVNSLGAAYQFMGVANTTTNPGTPDYNVAYLCGPGTYQYFNNITIPAGNIAILRYNGTWYADTLAVSGGGGGGGSVVTVQQVQTTGTKIATITVDNVATDIYAPSGGGGGYQPNGLDIDLNANNQLQFANRSAATGQKGYCILRSDSTFASQVSGKTNTIFEVRHSFDFGGQMVTLPENCVLKFNGGQITNGLLECSTGVEIYNGIIKNCTLLVRGNFKLKDSYILRETPTDYDENIGQSFHGREPGAVICEDWAANDTYVEITGCVIVNTALTDSVYNDTVKFIANEHNITFTLCGNYLSSIHHAVVESQSDNGHSANGICCDNHVIMGGSTGYGLGISFVAYNSHVIVANNYIESRVLGIEYGENVLIENNVIKMSSPTAYAIQTSSRSVSGKTIISGNKVICGRVGVIHTLSDTIIDNNVINGLVLLDGRDFGGGGGIGNFWFTNNTVDQDTNDKTEYSALTIYRNGTSKGIIKDNVIYDRCTLVNNTEPVAFHGISNCDFIGNTFNILGSHSEPIRIIEPANVRFNDNKIFVETVTGYGGYVSAVHLEGNSNSTFVAYRNFIEFGNLASLITDVLFIQPFRDIYSQLGRVAEDDTTVVKYNELKVGSSANRPNIPLLICLSKYYDTTLGKPLFWNYPFWVDSTGTQV